LLQVSLLVLPPEAQASSVPPSQASPPALLLPALAPLVGPLVWQPEARASQVVSQVSPLVVRLAPPVVPVV
jgi:hypothetical protein